MTSDKNFQPMLPSMVELDLEAGLRSFIDIGYNISTPGFLTKDGTSNVIRDFVDGENAFIKGPWLDLKLPFRTENAELATLLPTLVGRVGLKLPKPYAHQALAFQRLAKDQPESTIVATGTGSGKTECFVLPILDRVIELRQSLRQANKNPNGIKAIIIYPMNALATDQARRFANLCHQIRNTKPKDSSLDLQALNVSVGLYVGDNGEVSRTMEKDQVINDHKTLRNSPPDILLTNYKMLDFLLLRHEDKPLWEGCTPDTFKYLVVDELHTFDGAQGTDLACLIRRLRAFIGTTNQLACVGTSATLGDDGAQALLQYASDVFKGDFDETSVITEDRLLPEEFLALHQTDTSSQRIAESHWPKLSELKAFREQLVTNDYEQFINNCHWLWFKSDLPLNNPKEACTRLAKELVNHKAFQKLIAHTNEKSTINLRELAQVWQSQIPELKRFSIEDILLTMRTLVALISTARTELDNGFLIPFLNVRIQM